MEYKETLQKIATNLLNINHVGVQCDNIHDCEFKHQTILMLDKLDKHDAIRLLVHIIHVQQLQIADANIQYTDDNPFRDMVEFNNIDSIIKMNSPNMDSLY